MNFFSIPVLISDSKSPEIQLQHAGKLPLHILKTEGARIYFWIKINRELTRARLPAPPFPQPLHEFFLKPGFYCIFGLNSMPSTILNTVVVDEHENSSGWNPKRRRIRTRLNSTPTPKHFKLPFFALASYAHLLFPHIFDYEANTLFRCFLFFQGRITRVIRMGNYSEASRSISASQKGDWDSRCYKFPLNVKAPGFFIVFFSMYRPTHPYVPRMKNVPLLGITSPKILMLVS